MKKTLNRSWFFIVPLILIFLSVITHTIHYITVDDIDMMMIAESFNINPHSEQLMFINVVLGYLLKAFYTIVPNISWFFVLYITIVLVDFCILFRIASKYENCNISYAILSLILLFILNNITFTSLAFLTFCVALLYSVEYVKCLNKDSIKHLVVSFFLFFLAVCIRGGDIFYFILTVSVVLVIFAIKYKNITKSAGVLVIAILVFSNFLALGIQNYYSAKYTESTYYNNFHEYRGAVIDNQVKDYEKQKEALQAAGISENDYDTFVHWIFADKEVFSKEKVKAMADSLSFEEKYETNPIELIKTLFQVKIRLFALIVFSCLALVLFLLMKKRRAEILSLYLIIMANIGYLFIRRRPLSRVVITIIIMAIIIYLFVFIKENIDLSKLKFFSKCNKPVFYKISSVFLALIVCLYFAGSCYIINNQQKSAMYSQKIMDYVNEQNDKTFIMDWVHFREYRCALGDNSLFKKIPNNNCLPLLGGCYIYTYWWYSEMDRLDFSDYYDNGLFILLNDNVEYAAGNETPDMITNYFKEHYDLNVQYTVVKSYDEQGVYIYDFDIVK